MPISFLPFNLVIPIWLLQQTGLKKTCYTWPLQPIASINTRLFIQYLIIPDILKVFEAVFVVCLITATTSVHLMLKPTRIRRTAPTRAATGRFTNFKLLCNPTYNNNNNNSSGSFFSGSSNRTKLAAAALVSCGQQQQQRQRRQQRQLNLSKFKSPDRSCLTIDATEGPGVGFASSVSAVADFKL